METPEQKLHQFRAQIDAVDEQLAQLLVHRIGIIREVAKLKAANWPKPCHIRPGREGEMHRAIAKRFTGTGFAPLMALAIWRQLIGGSTHVESPLNVTYLDAHPEHRFLAREYFGVQIGATRAATLAEALDTIKNGRSNILILPTPTIVPPPIGGRLGGGLYGTQVVPPTPPPQPSPYWGGSDSDWWRDAALLKQAGLYIFATLPVAAGNLPEGCTPAVALAALTPEDSGDDVSYFVESSDATHVTATASTTASPRLIIVDGFQSTREGAAFLGAHPRAVHLTQGVQHA